jgi:cobalt/nickel transport system permease protein
MKPTGFVEHTIENLYEAIHRALYAETVAVRKGLLQPIDPRVKVLGLVALLLAAVLATQLWAIAGLLAIGVLLAVLSGISIGRLASGAWIGALFLSGMIAAPALFLTPGASAVRLPGLGWIITAQGIRTAAYLLLRVETAVTFTTLLVFTTPWPHVLKALRAVGAPVVLVVILGMTSRYILLMLETAHQMFESRKSRTVGAIRPADRRLLAIASAGVLLSKTFQLSAEVYFAMQARGFRGEIYLVDDFQMTVRDWFALASFVALAAATVWIGR